LSDQYEATVKAVLPAVKDSEHRLNNV